MWKLKLNLAPVGAPCSHTNNGVMAHRRAVGGRNLLLGAVVAVVFAVLLAGSVYVSNQVTDMRAEISRLEDKRGFLEAGSARLLTVWNKETAPSVITGRARRELGLVVPDEPGLVLVQLRGDEQRTSAWRRLLENMGGADPVQASEMNPSWVMGSMVSLTPRTSPAQEGR